MKRALILLLIILAGCQASIECNEKITCDDGSVYPAEHIVQGECVKVEYEEDPCRIDECETDEDCIPEKPMMGAQYKCEEGACIQLPLGNPASEHCEAKGGTLETRETENGTIGICTLATGEECEEWAYYRGECPETTAVNQTNAKNETAEPRTGCGLESLNKRAECCQEQLSCPITKISVYNEDADRCTCEEIEIKRSCAAYPCDAGYFSQYERNRGKCICVEAGRSGEIRLDYEGEFTKEIAEQLILEAFDQKWSKVGSCGYYEDGMQRPDKIEIRMLTDGSYKADVYYYCGEYFHKPAEPDHHKEVTVTEKGVVTGLN